MELSTPLPKRPVCLVFAEFSHHEIGSGHLLAEVAQTAFAKNEISLKLKKELNHYIDTDHNMFVY